MTDTLGLLRAVVTQLIQNSDMTDDIFINLFGPTSVAAIESFQAASLQVLENVVTAIARTMKVVVVIDALDECEDTKTLLGLITRLLSARSVNILMSSRPSASIRKAWDQLATFHPGACHELALSPSMNKSDIELYVTETVESMITSRDLSLRDPKLREEIVDALKSRSDGM